MIIRGVVIAQWIRLRLPYYRPGSNPKHSIYAFIIYSQICTNLQREKNKNKQKEAELGPIFYKKNNKEPVGGT